MHLYVLYAVLRLEGIVMSKNEAEKIALCESLVVSWQVCSECNFNCKYCFSHTSGRPNMNVSGEEVLLALQRTGRRGWG